MDFKNSPTVNGLSLVNFVAGQIPSGATVPTSPTDGQWFLHTPTGRVVLLQYYSGTWHPHTVYGNATLYVDRASGADTINKGTGTGSNAFASINYAISQVQCDVYGSVTINISADATAYAENVLVTGVNLVGGGNITLQGTLAATLESVTATGGSAGSLGSPPGTPGSAGTVTWGWSGTSRQNKLIKGTTAANANLDVYRVIDTHTSTTVTIVGTWPTAPVNTNTFIIVEPGTIIAPASGTAVAVLQQGVVLNFLKLTGSASGYGLYVANQGGVFAQYCYISGTGTFVVFTNTAVNFNLYQSAVVIPSGSPIAAVNFNNTVSAVVSLSKIDTTLASATTYGVYAGSMYGLTWVSNTVSVAANNYGMWADSATTATFASSNGNCRFTGVDSGHKAATGLVSYNGSSIKNATFTTDYANCTTNSSADTASYSSIS